MKRWFSCWISHLYLRGVSMTYIFDNQHLIKKNPHSLFWTTSTHRSMVTHRPESWMINFHPFRSIWIGPPIRQFQTLTFKIQGQYHGCSHIIGRVSNWLASISFHMNQTIYYWDSVISISYLEKFKVKVMCEFIGQGHIVDPVSKWYFLSISHQFYQPFLRCGQQSVWTKKNTWNFEKICQKKVPNKLPKKCNQMITINTEIELWIF